MLRRLWLVPVLAAVVAAIVLSRSPASEPASEEGSLEAVRASEAPRAAEPEWAAGPQALRLEELGRFPHDESAFTQGLLWHGGKLYESTGQYGASRLRRIDLESGRVEQETQLADDLFGEGLTLVGVGEGAELVWLTWKAGRALRFDLETFRSQGEFRYEGEGWGLCAGSDAIYRTDGTATLWTHAIDDFRVLSRVQVTLRGDPVRFLNELECTPEGILANIWHRDEIARIDPASGRVTAVIDASGLLAAGQRRPEAVLNGIATRPETGTLLITGKHWPWVFEAALVSDEN